MKGKKSTIGDGHPDSKFANELGALHKYKICYIYSETGLCDHLRNRDNLGIKDSYSSA